MEEEYFMFTPNELNNEINRLIKDNPILKDYDSFVSALKDRYYKARLYFKSKNIYNDYEGHVRILSDQFQSLEIGEDWMSTLKGYAQNKHMEYFDFYIGDGASEEISNIISQYGYSIDDLKGLKSFTSMSVKSKDGRLVTEQKFSDEPNESPVFLYLKIYFDGKLIYDSLDKIFEEDYEQDIKQLYDRFMKGEKIGKAKPTKTNEVNSYEIASEQVYNWATDSKNIISTRISKSGHIYKYNETTHRLMGSVKRK